MASTPCYRNSFNFTSYNPLYSISAANIVRSLRAWRTAAVVSLVANNEEYISGGFQWHYIHTVTGVITFHRQSSIIVIYHV
jgi:hypothetical protein